MDGADRRDPHIAGQTSYQELADLARTPMVLLPFGRDNQPLDRLRQLVGITHRSSRSIAQRIGAVLLVAIKELVAGLTGNPEFPAHIRHSFAFEKTRNKA